MTAGALGLAALVAVCPVGALARPGQPPPSLAERCLAWLDDLHGAFILGDAVSITARADGGCRYEGLTIGPLHHTGYAIATLDVHGIDFDPSRDVGPPMTLRIEARGVREVQDGVGGAWAWVMRQMRRSFDVVMDVTLDPEAHVATLHELSMTGAAIGRAELDAEIDGTDAFDRAGTGPLGLRALHGRLDSGTILLTYGLPALLGFSSDTDPVKAIAGDKLVASAVLRGALPRASATTATIDAVVGFVADFPAPSHPFELTVSTPGGLLTIDDVERATGGPDGVGAMMSKLRVTATYAGRITDRSAQ